ncbi:hypothetical protein G6F35_018167 [Rhizopus arrhizus]|nr:hypothetical protein G6F35_018167 [Rhizopus arrhizus]
MLLADMGADRELRVPEPQQEVGDAEPERSGRPGPGARTGADRRRADRKQPAGRDGPVGAGLCAIARSQSQAGLLLDLGLRPIGPAVAGRGV